MLSLLYRAGMYVHRFHVDMTPKGSMPIGMGPVESASAGFAAAHLNHLSPVLANKKALRAAHGLQAFYRQTTKVGRLALGWTLLEDLFGDTSGYHHILSEDEQDVVEQLISASSDLDPQKKLAVIARFRDTSVFRKSRNELMAERIAVLLGEDGATVYKTMKDLSKARGKVLHSFKAEADIDVSQWERFIENTVLHYIRSQSGIIVMRLRGS